MESSIITLLGSLNVPEYSPSTLSDAQKGHVQSILDAYDPHSLTTDDVRSINQSMMEAGIRPSADLKGLLESAGFDAEQLRNAGRQEDEATVATAPGQSNNGINPDAMGTLKSLLQQYDLEHFTEAQQQKLHTELEQAGLMEPGSMLDLRA